MKKLKVDQALCDGFKVCISMAPDVFEIDKNGKSFVKNQNGADVETIQQAIDACPAQAISWEEE